MAGHGEGGETRRPEHRLIAALYGLHEEAGDPSLHAAWPDHDGALDVLRYVRAHRKALYAPAPRDGDRRRQEQARLRLELIHLLRKVLDEHEGAALDDAREAGLTWQAIAPIVGVRHRGAAANRRDRLRAAVEAPGEARTPSTGRSIVERQRKAFEKEQREARRAARRSRTDQDYQRVLLVARELIAHAKQLAVNQDADEWLRDAQGLADLPTPTPSEKRALAAVVRLAAQEIVGYASAAGEPAASTDEAAASLEAARRLDLDI